MLFLRRKTLNQLNCLCTKKILNLVNILYFILFITILLKFQLRFNLFLIKAQIYKHVVILTLQYEYLQ